MASGAIKALFERWEKDGAMAFEETPGSWTDSVDGVCACGSMHVAWRRAQARQHVPHMPALRHGACT
eukprot:365930-Chlamydomonas_euryale.AAC.27